jgi:L-malate glycosyltransferase
MRVCHVISGDLWAGAEMMCLRLLTGLGEKNGLELSAILMNEGKLAREIRRLDIPVEIVDETQLDFFRAAGLVQKILAKFKPDILHTHRLKENALGFLSARRSGRRIPLICTQHGLDEPQSRLKWKLLSGANRYLLARHFRTVVAVSEDMRTGLSERHKLSPRKLVVIHNGTELRDRIPAERGNRPFTIGSAGRLFPVKDYSFLVEVAAEAHRHAGDIRFELAGEGPEFGKLTERIGRFGLQEVFSLKGFVENMSGFYMGLDLYINTSLHEGFPMSVLEAMSHGLPVIAPMKGGIREAVADGVEGFLIEERDPKRFAQKCLEIYRDRELRSKMGAASRERVAREFSIETMAEKYFELYRKVLSQPERADLS